jgi:hypothetical protein
VYTLQVAARSLQVTGGGGAGGDDDGVEIAKCRIKSEE